jgi:hypothetical protein
MPPASGLTEAAGAEPLWLTWRSFNGNFWAEDPEGGENEMAKVSHTRPLPLGRRLVGGLDNAGDILAIADGEDCR